MQDDVNHTKENLSFIDSFMNLDEESLKLMKSLRVYRDSYCERLRKIIKGIIDYICKNYSEKENYCDADFQNLIEKLCKYYELYRKYCCNPCCGPKTPDFDIVVENLRYVTLYLNPGTVRPGDIGIDIPNLSEYPVDFKSTCETTKAVINKYIVMLCENKDKDLCLNNELTQAISRLCKLFPEYKKNCCK